MTITKGEPGIVDGGKVECHFNLSFIYAWYHVNRNWLQKNKFATYSPCNEKATESELTILPCISLTRSGFRSFLYSNLVLSGNAPNRYCLLTNGILTLGFPHRHITAKRSLVRLDLHNSASQDHRSKHRKRTAQFIRPLSAQRTSGVSRVECTGDFRPPVERLQESRRYSYICKRWGRRSRFEVCATCKKQLEKIPLEATLKK